MLAVIPGLLALGAAILRDGSASFLRHMERFDQLTDWPFRAVIIMPMALLASAVLAWTLTVTFAVLNWTGNQLLPLFVLVGIMAHVIINLCYLAGQRHVWQFDSMKSVVLVGRI